MDVLLVAGFIAALIFSYLSFNKASTLKRESEHLSELLVRTINEHERALNDHRESVQELAIIKAKLEGVKSSTLTPDNSIPKHVHVEKVIEMSQNLQSVKAELESMTEQFEKSRGKQRSEQVRMGLIGEQFATLHENFKYDRKETKALLQPVDFVCFEETEVVFVDVKTGDSCLSPKQRKIRDNIRAGRVRWEVFRINENGANWEE